jgi:hypothetical protein
MSATNIIDHMPGEAKDLALHTALCEQRYLQLINKFDQVDARLDNIEEMLVGIRTQLSTDQTAQFKMYLAWAGVIIMGLAGALGHFILK